MILCHRRKIQRSSEPIERRTKKGKCIAGIQFTSHVSLLGPGLFPEIWPTVMDEFGATTLITSPHDFRGAIQGEGNPLVKRNIYRIGEIIGGCGVTRKLERKLRTRAPPTVPPQHTGIGRKTSGEIMICQRMTYERKSIVVLVRSRSVEFHRQIPNPFKRVSLSEERGQGKMPSTST
ncbi:hypothetical protein Trydic_g11698 [Trypoxylus dichotomus]